MVSVEELRNGIEWKYVAAGLVVLVAAVLAMDYRPMVQGDEGAIEATLAVQKPSQNLTRSMSLENGTSAFHALNSTFSVEYQESSMGIFITSIDGLAQNNTHSWVYVVNGDPPSVGAGQYRVRDGDSIGFRYMSNDRALKFFEE